MAKLADAEIRIYWSSTRKCWRIMGYPAGDNAAPITRECSSPIPIGRSEMRAIVESVVQELYALIPFPSAE